MIEFDTVMEKKDIEFEAELEDQAMIEADKDLMALVWNNLLSNAVKFTPPGGSIVLRQHTDSDGIIVSISDTGCGMDRDTQKKIFEKFYQGVRPMLPRATALAWHWCFASCTCWTARSRYRANPVTAPPLPYTFP